VARMTNAEPRTKKSFSPDSFRRPTLSSRLVAEPPDSILGIVVVHGTPSCLMNVKSLSWYLTKSHLQGFSGLRSVGLCGKRLEVFGHAPLVSL